MADAVSIKKTVKKLDTLWEKLTHSTQEDIPALESDLAEVLLEFRTSDQAVEPDFIESSTKILNELKIKDPAFYPKFLYDVIGLSPQNPVLIKLKFDFLADSTGYEEIIKLLDEDKDFTPDSKDLETILSACDALGKYDAAAIFLSKRLIFFEPLFRRYGEIGYGTQLDEVILRNFLNESGHKSAISFLELLKGKSANVWARLRIIELLEIDNKAEMISEIERFPFHEIRELPDFRKISEVLIRNNLLSETETVLNFALAAFNDDYELLKFKGEVLLKKTETIEAYEIFKDLAERNNTDHEVIKKAISMAYDLNLCDECLGLVGNYPESSNDIDILSKKIYCELQTSKFNEALNDISAGLVKYPDNFQLLTLRFKTLVKLGNENEAYNLARTLMTKSPDYREASDFAMNELLKRGEFKEILEICNANENIKMIYMPAFISAEIFEGKTKDALKIISEKPDLLNEDLVIDAIFFNVRSDEILNRLEEIAASYGDLKPSFKIVSGKLRGTRLNVDALTEEYAKNNGSRAVAYIISYDTLILKTTTLSEKLQGISSSMKFKDVRATMDLISQANSGKLSDDVIDSPRYLFPITESLIRTGQIDRAEAELIRTAHSDDDPFYRFNIALIDFQRGNYPSSRKNQEYAVQKLRNSNFLKLGMNLSVVTNEPKKLRENLEEIVRLKAVNFFDFSEVYRHIVKGNFWDMAEILVSVDTDGSTTNPWIIRLKRDLLIKDREYKKGEEQSLLLFSTNQFTMDDVTLHLDLMDKQGKPNEAINFLLDLETDYKTKELEIIVGDRYYAQSSFQKALVHYNLAISLGSNPSEIRNYADTLIENKKFQEANDILGGSNNDLLRLKLYQKTSDIQAALQLLKNLNFKGDDEQKVVKFAADNLWYNTDVKELLVNLYREEGYTWLGKIIAARTLKNGDKKLALEISRNLNKNLPDNMDIMRLYCDVLIQTGERTEAIELILRSLKFCKSMDTCQDIVNNLLRLYYEDRDFEELIRFYETNQKFVDENSLQYVIRAYMELDRFDIAEKLMSRYEGTLLPKDIHNELRDDLKVKKEFMETILYVTRLLKMEYKVGKKFDRKEAFYKADIPIEKIEDVYEFLNSRDFYFDVNEEKYEILSRDVIQKAAKAVDMESIKDLTINVIFNSLDRKDPIIARNIYIYIRDQMDVARRPQIKNEVLLKLLRVALRENVKHDVLHVAFFLKLGISEALDVMTLMEYMTKMNREGEI
ncbi:MAG: hypothetical protein M1393_01480 [Candidatus Thermoplasmatota archaeon]|nr:hypothetical protein [Candidatus Thermoplasmatota archaeon]